MILRRVISHMKNQHWTAVFLDFVIVVMGVFMGLQVQNWNAGRIERAALGRELASLRIEMETNLAVIQAYKEDKIGQLKAIQYLRGSFTRGAGFDDAKAMNQRLMDMYRVGQFNVDTSAYETLLNSGYLNRLAGTPLYKAILDWETARAEVAHLHDMALSFRQDATDSLLGILSFEAMIDKFNYAKPYNAPPHFQNDFAALAKSRKLASYLALRTGIEAQTLSYIDNLQARTQKLANLLAEREGKK